jgi:SAM-dependent methyltransferase
VNPDEYRLMYSLEEEHWYFKGKRRIVADLIGRHLTNRAEPHILDVGCGTGRMAEDLSALGDLVALDPSSEATAYTRSRGFFSVAQGSAEALPFENESFDLVTALDVIEHVQHDDMALSEMARVLRPGGIAVITVPAFMFLWSGHDEALHHKRRYRKPELAGKVSKAGLQVQRCSYFNAVFFPAVAAMRISRRYLGIDRHTSDTNQLPAKWLNKLLLGVISAEMKVLRYLDLPAGVSLLCLAVKK